VTGASSPEPVLAVAGGGAPPRTRLCRAQWRWPEAELPRAYATLAVAGDGEHQTEWREEQEQEQDQEQQPPWHKEEEPELAACEQSV
jgi:hypothetical protein